MPQVQYIGTCNKQDSIRGIGLYWEPEQVRAVSPEVAERLLHFRDTWIRVEGKVDHSEQIGLTADEKPFEEPLPVVNFHAMDKNAMVEYAERNYNERLDKRQSEDTIRHKLVALFGQHEFHEGK